MKPESVEIRGDVSCACGYNLRGLTFDHNCPECGRPVRQSAAQGVRSDSPRKWEEVESLLRRRALLERVVARSGGVTSGGVWWIVQAYRYAAFRGGGGGDVKARALCAALRDYVRVELKTEYAAVAALARVGIRSSEDVGRVIREMVEAGALRRSPEDSISDFDGLFTLENLFSVNL